MKRTWHFPLAALALATLVLGAWEYDAETSGSQPEGNVRVDLTAGDFVVSVVPSLGGRVVGLRAGKGPNLLAWDERYEQGPLALPSLETPFAPWNGRILWVGPQSAWWSDQDLSPERKAAKPPWPPDPFHEAARYEVVERTSTLLVMRGPVSPITGLEFTETVEIVGPRKVRFVAVATNRRVTSVAWDLWPNTRVRPEGWPYVRIGPGSVPRIDGPKGGRAAAYPHRIVDGFLTLPPGVRPAAPAQQLHVKVFLQPASGEIAYFLGVQLLRLQAELVPPERLHPEQAFVELYRGAGADPASDILELEMHGPYVRVGPGESMRFEQTAEVLDYVGAPTAESHVVFLKSLQGAVESKAILR
jgi:Domain of unknown function (DUF4380)